MSSTERVRGRTLVSRRAVAALVRRTTATVYGVVDVSGPGRLDDLFGWLGLTTSGVRIVLTPALRIDIYIAVARGTPAAEVARNVEEAVRFRLRRGLGREPDDVHIHVGAFELAHHTDHADEQQSRPDTGPAAT